MVNFSNEMMSAAAGGGIILGMATSLNFVLYGKLTGASGITDNVFIGPLKPTQQQKEEVDWQKAFLIGLFHAGYAFITYLTPTKSLEQDVLPITILILAGILVGFGSRLGNGCTSGHGICGLARFSIRGITSVLTFLTTAIITTNLVYSNNSIVNFDDITTTEQTWFNNFMTTMEIDPTKISLSRLLLIEESSVSGEVGWFKHNNHLGLAFIAFSSLQLFRMIVQAIMSRPSNHNNNTSTVKLFQIFSLYSCGAIFGTGLHLSKYVKTHGLITIKWSDDGYTNPTP